MAATLAVLGLLLGLAGLWLKPVEAPLVTSVDMTRAFLRQARVTAMASTSAYRVRPLDDRRLLAEFANSCSSTSWTIDADLGLTLPDPVSLTDTSWQVCFNPRGTSWDSLEIVLAHPTRGDARIQILRGGTTRVVP